MNPEKPKTFPSATQVFQKKKKLRETQNEFMKHKKHCLEEQEKLENFSTRAEKSLRETQKVFGRTKVFEKKASGNLKILQRTQKSSRET